MMVQHSSVVQAVLQGRMQGMTTAQGWPLGKPGWPMTNPYAICSELRDTSTDQMGDLVSGVDVTLFSLYKLLLSTFMCV